MQAHIEPVSHGARNAMLSSTRHCRQIASMVLPQRMLHLWWFDGHGSRACWIDQVVSFSRYGADVAVHVHEAHACRDGCQQATTIRRVYREIDPTLAEDAVIDLVLSFDGSWMTRGHKSANGIGCVIDTVTGLCMDMVVLSLYCQRCSYAQRRFGGRATNEFREWFETHREKCNRNFDGFSGGVEAV